MIFWNKKELTLVALLVTKKFNQISKYPSLYEENLYIILQTIFIIFNQILCASVRLFLFNLHENGSIGAN